SDGNPLISMLARVQRRLRLLAAAEGAVMGSAVGTLGLGLGLLVARSGGAGLGAGGGAKAAALLLAFGAGGALAGALRKGPLDRCARVVDRALDGQDRVLSALAFARAPAATAASPATQGPFAAATIRDALRRAAGVAPAVAVPFRRPAGLGDLALGAAVVAFAALVPAAARGSRPPAPGAAAPRAREAGVRLGAGALDAEREEAAAALAAAGALDDRRLQGLA